MTMALCFHCGNTKFGAIVPCPKCHVGSSGDINLDIAFSDHRISVSTIDAFGKVIESIRAVCDDDETRFWAFIRFVSRFHPEILGVSLPPDQERELDAILDEARPPPVVVEESMEAHFFREHDAK